jgi:3-oxoacyl-[acyl-carrier-protein] synthase-3
MSVTHSPSDTRRRTASVGLSRVAVCLPRRMEPVEDILVRAGRGAMERKMFAKVHGLRHSPTLAADERIEDLLVEAGRAALGGETAGTILYGHTMLAQEFGVDGGFPDRLRARLGLTGADFFGLSHINCTSVLRGVELARAYLVRPDAGPDDRVLVLGGDHGSVDDRSRVIPGMAVGGDAAVGVVVSALSDAATPGRRPRYRYVAGATGREPRFHRNLRMSAAEAAEFSKVCGEETAATLRRAARAAGLDTGQLDWVMPHLSNRMFWGMVAKRAGIPKDRICLDLIPERGHNFGTDALMALEHADRAGRLRPGDHCALVSLAQGAYFQAVIVAVEENP